MRIFYDTEFLEDGRTIELISIGMVADDDRTLYLVNEEVGAEPLHGRIRKHQWLMDHVVPNLPLRSSSPLAGDALTKVGNRITDYRLDMETNAVVSRRYIRNAVRDFILGTPDPEMWAWYGAYDHVVLAQLWGPMINLPKGIPMWTNDLRQEVQRLGNPQVPTFTDSGSEHFALADALELRERARWLERMEGAEQHAEPAF